MMQERFYKFIMIVLTLLVMQMWTQTVQLWCLDIVLEKHYTGYDPNDDKIHWVSPNTLAIDNWDNAYIVLINVEQNKVRKLTAPDIAATTKCWYRVLDVDMDAQMFLFEVIIEKLDQKITDKGIHKYYLYDVASDKLTNLETEAQAIEANPDAYFKEFRYFDEIVYDAAAQQYYVKKSDRYAILQDVISGKTSYYHNYYYLKRAQYDKEWGMFFNTYPNRSYQYDIIPYDGRKLGEARHLDFNIYPYYWYTKILLGKYLIGAGESTTEESSEIVITNIDTKVNLKLEKLDTADHQFKMISINPQKNLIAVCAFYNVSDGREPFTPGIFIFRYYPRGEVNDSRVRYRSGPSTSAEVLGMFEKGERVMVLERSARPMTIGEDTKYWYKVRRSDGKAVWMYGAFLTIVN